MSPNNNSPTSARYYYQDRLFFVADEIRFVEWTVPADSNEIVRTTERSVEAQDKEPAQRTD